MHERRDLERELSDLGLSSGRPGEVIGGDTRRKVENSVAVPFRWICRVVTTENIPQPTEGRWGGTGLLIGPRHVLTCAHVIYPVEQHTGKPRFRTQSITVFPAQNGADEPLGSFSANGWTIHRQWYTGREVNGTFDYGLVRLREPIGAKGFRALGGQTLGWWGSPEHGHGTRFARLDPATLAGQTVAVAGYPFRRGLNELAARVLKVGEGHILGSAVFTRLTEDRFEGRFSPRVEPTSRVLLHDADTSRAQSGCPVWTQDAQGGLDLIGLHQGQLASSTPINGATTVNLALRVTQEFLQQVSHWRATFVEGRR